MSLEHERSCDGCLTARTLPDGPPMFEPAVPHFRHSEQTLRVVCLVALVGACSSTSPADLDGAPQGGSGVRGGRASAGTGGSAGSLGQAGAAGSSGAPSSGGTSAGGGAMNGTSGSTSGGGAAAGSTSTAGNGGSAGSASGAGGNGGASGGSGGAGGSGGGNGSGRSSGCGKAPTIPSSMYNGGQHIAITAANMQREYILNVPASYDKDKPYRLIIAYHELNGDDNEMYRNQYYHLLPLSNETTIFVAPNGQKDGANCSSASNCGWPNPNGSDLALADAVVAQVEENFCIDTNRIFATGWSYGGSMSYKTACERPLGSDKGFVRGIAVYSAAQLSGNCTPSKAVAYYGSHGTSDSVLNYDGGVGLSQNFSKVNGCTWMTPAKVTSGNHVCTNLMGCTAEHPTQFCSFNGDHTPDPKDSNQQTSWQYQLVWDFFSKL